VDGQQHPSSGHAGQVVHPAAADYTGPAQYGAGGVGPYSSPFGKRPVDVGDLVLAGGGLLFFVASFLPWISLDLGVTLRCDEFSDPELRASCEAGFGAIPTDVSASAWDLILTSTAAVLMILVAGTAVAMGLRVMSGIPTMRQVVAAAVLVVDVILLTFVAMFDFSSLGAAFAQDAIGDFPGAASAGIPGLSLALGFWLAVGGLLMVNVGMVVAQRHSRGPGQPRS